MGAAVRVVLRPNCCAVNGLRQLVQSIAASSLRQELRHGTAIAVIAVEKLLDADVAANDVVDQELCNLVVTDPRIGFVYPGGACSLSSFAPVKSDK